MPAHVRGNRPQPRPEPAGVTQLIEPHISLHERLLGRVLDIVEPPEVVIGDRAHGVAIAVNKLGKSRMLARQCPRYQLAVKCVRCQ